jgi:hypothetical protein
MNTELLGCIMTFVKGGVTKSAFIDQTTTKKGLSQIRISTGTKLYFEKIKLLSKNKEAINLPAITILK